MFQKLRFCCYLHGFGAREVPKLAQQLRFCCYLHGFGAREVAPGRGSGRLLGGGLGGGLGGSWEGVWARNAFGGVLRPKVPQFYIYKLPIVRFRGCYW